MVAGDDPVSSSPSDPPPRPHGAIPLDYHVPRREPALLSREVPRWVYEAAGAAAVVLGFIVLPLPFASAAPHGSALIFAGAGWWTIHRAQRTGKPRLVWAVQVLLACGIVAVGMFRLGHFVHGADPQGWSYWLTENQTYKHTRSKALPLLWVPAVGVAWLGLLGIVWSARRLARTREGRNNPGPQ